MKGNLHPKNDVTINPSGNETIREILDRVDFSRRKLLKSGMGAAALAACGGVPVAGLFDTLAAAPIPASTGFAGIGFESIPPQQASLNANGTIASKLLDVVSVPRGYTVEPLVFWGDPIAIGGAPWLEDASQTAEDQEKQYGEHTDGMHFFPLPDANPSARGLLCSNNEYTQETIIHRDGLDAATGGLPGSVVTIAKIRKSQAAHGVSILEISRETGKWRVVSNSRYGRRITANTPVKFSGPAAGAELMKVRDYNITSTGSTYTGKSTDGKYGWGTVNNCAHGYTPWGTYITCEENWNGYFGWKTASRNPTKLENRYGVSRTGDSFYKWASLDERWDAEVNPNGPNNFGWKVEIDPYDPTSTPVKRTSLGRCKTESAQLAVDPDNRFGFYMGDDERNEYMYKWVCNKKYNPTNAASNKDLLDDGVLYVAKFTNTAGSAPNTFRGEWIPLRPDTVSVVSAENDPNTKLTLAQMAEFSGANDAEVLANILIKTRMAADAVGATMMDRPEWSALRPKVNGFTKLEVYLTLTNNNRRGSAANATSNDPLGDTGAGSARPAVDAANPRPQNDYGHIIRWREDGDTVTATKFEWDIFVFCGDTRASQHIPNPKVLASASVPTGHDGFAGNIKEVPVGSADFGAPDGLWFDQFGRLWIQTDQVGDGSGDWQKIGANQMLAADPNTKEVRRFLTGPNKCEITGVVNTPDGRSMFVGIQHPGEDSLSANPTQFSNWPKSQFGGPGGRPRSGIVAITRNDNQIIGS